MSEIIRIGRQQFRVLFPGLLRPLSADERGELKADIAQRRCVDVPLIVDDGEPVMGLIDGEHRLRIAVEVGLDGVPVRRISGLSEAAKRTRAESLNVNRRQLSPAELHELRLERIERLLVGKEEGKSNRQLAAENKVSESQVRQDLAAAGAQGCAPEPPAGKVTGRDGKTYPATQPKPAARPEPSPATEEPAVKRVADLLCEGPRCEEGFPLNGQSLAAFLARERFEAALADLARVSGDLQGLAVRPGGEYMSVGQLHVALADAWNMVSRSQPYAACCPWCRNEDEHCQSCHGRGWVSREVWDDAGRERQQAVKAGRTG